MFHRFRDRFPFRLLQWLEKQRISEKRYRVLFESSRDAIMTLAPPSWKFTSGNPATVAMFATRDEAEFVSLGPWELSPEFQPDGRPSSEKAREMIETAMRTGSHFFEWRHKRLRGEAFPATVLLTRVELGGNVFLQATVKDISEQKQAEKEIIEARQAAEAATLAKTCFLANMSHEIRTPMTAILGFTDILLEELEKPQAREAAAIVKRNGEHLLTIINDILDISKIEAGKVEMEMISWSPRQIVAEVVSLLHVRANAKGLTLAGEYVGPLPETIVTDPTRLRQVLLNVVGNAIKFTDGGGVRIVTRLVNAAGDAPQIQFDVIDTGIGIPQNRIGQLFEPFTQLDASSTRRFEGTGLGLAISRRLAQRLGGDITAQSTPGQGSTFTITVAAGPLVAVRLIECPPESFPGEKRPVLPARESGEKLRCRVLLAEDIPDNQRLFTSILAESGAEVVVAQNGKEAIEKAMATRPGWGRRHSDPTQPFDVVLMDVQMPVLDGLEATRRLRELGYTGPIIALTAHAMRGDRQKCLDAGCDDYVTKPVDRKRLTEAVRTWALTRREHANPDAKPAAAAQDAKPPAVLVAGASGSQECPTKPRTASP